MISAPFHSGERAVQARTGSRERMAEIGPRVIRNAMPEQHSTFFAQLPFVIAGSVDAALQPWASVLAAPAGFAHAPDAWHLRVDAVPDAHDPLKANLRYGAPIGLLGIEPQTRRRNRLNGVVETLDVAGFELAVQQSFGNCPRYISPREALFVLQSPLGAAQPVEGFDAAARALVARADTFFIATAHPHAMGSDAASHGVDVSHRGGPSGFVRVASDGTLSVPDFAGNRFFNTLGNLVLNPRAGLLFIDFDSGDLLHLAVTATVVWDGPEVAALEGAERVLRLRVERSLRRPAALPLRWSGRSPGAH
ncbi:MAG: flavin-nucleotide-binding protein [Comamonadaceae bacterium]|nr:MAG: flavin-nucleotide-binding protein [Comamonadaceae bacterium]